jgi:beta-lactam-binding protein with PASTA domain
MFFKFLTSRIFWLNMLLALLVLVLLGFGTNVLLDNYTRHAESEEVPDLRGISYLKAKEILNEKKLRYQVVDSVFFAELPKMSVTEQIPAAGSKVKEDRVIYLTINSANPPLVKVPDLKDQSLRSAQSLLESMGLRVGKITEKPDIANDVVLKQGLAAGTTVAKGTEVPLTVGKADGDNMEEAEVPDLSGLTLDAAKDILEDAGFSAGAIVGESKGATIVKQNPSSGIMAKKGIAIDLYFQ